MGRIIRATQGYTHSSPERQLALRAVLVEVANYLERERCLGEEVPVLDRDLRILPVPDPPDPVDEEPTPDAGDEPYP